jgi:hypothetical protein
MELGKGQNGLGPCTYTQAREISIRAVGERIEKSGAYLKGHSPKIFSLWFYLGNIPIRVPDLHSKIVARS